MRMYMKYNFSEVHFSKTTFIRGVFDLNVQKAVNIYLQEKRIHDTLKFASQ